MAKWNKLIVSGSQAELAAVTASMGIIVTGSVNISGSLIINGVEFSSGSSGGAGSSGSSGSSGTSATAGSSGTSATAGSSGTSATAGSSGTSATAGSSGTSATAGSSGTSATAGSSGTSATAGSSGTSATAGSSGQTGSSGISGRSSGRTYYLSSWDGYHAHQLPSGNPATAASINTTQSLFIFGGSYKTIPSDPSVVLIPSGTFYYDFYCGVESGGGSGIIKVDTHRIQTGSVATTGIVTDITFTDNSPAPSAISRSSGNFITDGFLTGQTIFISGSANNNTDDSGFHIVSASTSTLFVQFILANESAGASVTISSYDVLLRSSISPPFTATDPSSSRISWSSYDDLAYELAPSDRLAFKLYGSSSADTILYVKLGGFTTASNSTVQTTISSPSAGSSGTSATAGSSGTSATAGSSGTSATAGSSGSSGTSATAGSSGTSATAGSSGTSATAGSSGTSATAGSSGTSATAGSSGTSATAGSSGTSATAGSSGTSATAGSSGTSATAGSSGTSATAGSSGTSATAGSSGTSATAGSSGTSATAGSSGLFGGDSQKYTFSTTTTDSDPGDGTFRFDTATYGSIAKIFIDDLNFYGTNISSSWIAGLDDSTNSVKGTLRLFKEFDASVFVYVNITAANTIASGYTKLNVTYVTSSGAFSNSDAVVITFARAGDAGSSGSSGTSATAGSSGTSATAGSSGTSATAGSSGTSATAGSSGSSGTSATAGSSGTSATAGSSGTSATAGSSGVDGSSGSSGTSATAGSSGTSATAGSSGTSATAGSSGTSATAGSSGTSATAGSSGTSATAGTSGGSGVSGSSGTSGTSGETDMYTTTYSGSHTLVIGDAYRLISMVSGAANYVTIPSSSVVLFPIGVQIAVEQSGSGTTYITSGSTNVIIEAVSLSVGSQYSVVGLIQKSLDRWLVTTAASGTSGTSATAGSSGTAGTSGQVTFAQSLIYTSLRA